MFPVRFLQKICNVFFLPQDCVCLCQVDIVNALGLVIIIIIIVTATELSFGGSSSYSGTDRQNK